MSSGRRALVTGGGTGIGLACAQALRGAGLHVTVMGRREAPLRAAGADAWIIGDVTAPPTLPRFDVLVNAAGIAPSAPFHRSHDALFRQAIETNLLGAVAITRAVLPPMLEAGWGRIIHIASTAALKGYAYTTAYTASKHAMLGFVRALAQEIAARGVTINALCPGFTETEIVAESIVRISARTGRSAEEARAELTRPNPQGRLVQPAEVAAAALFLAGDAAAAIHGAAIPVAGGEI
ncbi:MAG: SDR family NAD(P)-dependent oxidoreductase [Alphaproteobacteria bacterium]|nr:SDR family NAD(P)-dependent oxidoreductase [Alphaproteobacteria bacterium]